MPLKKLLVGTEDFKKVIDKQGYYVDKTLLIKELIDKGDEVNLFTRPRRFGKTLNLSMLKYFFEDTGDVKKSAELFQGLKIAEDTECMQKHLGKYPVISLTLKSGKQNDFEKSFYTLKESIAFEFERHLYAVDKLVLEGDKERFLRYSQMYGEEKEYYTAIKFLSKCLCQVHQSKVVILIDEYDVPLENAYFNGFYDEMIGFIRSLFESALKTNPFLEFAVVTGCLQISKESVFTGLNNLRVRSILDEVYGEYFGFTQGEVDAALNYYDRESRGEEVKQWYDGYLFGNQLVYNPWSVLSIVDKLTVSEEAYFESFWPNTSSNDIVHTLIEKSDTAARDDIEKLMDGGTIEKIIRKGITYADLDKAQDHIWSFLLFTGYLTLVSARQVDDEQYLTMAIPNREVKYIYRTMIIDWFNDRIKTKDLRRLYQAVVEGDAGVLEEELSEIMMESISYNDYKEDYYHGLVLGLLKTFKGYKILSNDEKGLGRPDILMVPFSSDKPAVIMELKFTRKKGEVKGKCNEVLQQIKERKYKEGFGKGAYNRCVCFGICFYQKMCMVKREGGNASNKNTPSPVDSF
ncbi:ATP-binding protein [Lachnospiraceae bacterium ZAX-1]